MSHTSGNHHNAHGDQDMVYWPAAAHQCGAPIWLKRVGGRPFAGQTQGLGFDIMDLNYEAPLVAITSAVVEWADPHVYHDPYAAHVTASELTALLARLPEAPF